MKTWVALTAWAVVATVLAGCAGWSDTQRGAATGAGLGALGGAALGGLIDGARGARAGAALGAIAGAGGGYVWSARMQEQKRAMEQAAQGTGVTVIQTPDNQLKLEVPSDISFRIGRADIEPALRPVLDRFAQTLVMNPATWVRIVGHTDSTGTPAINDPLSLQRAASVRAYLSDRGVTPARISIDGRGSREPLADNSVELGRARNRRVEVFVAEAAPDHAR